MGFVTKTQRKEGFSIKTFNDFEKAADKGAFIKTAISEYKSSETFKRGLKANGYYDGDNPDIMHRMSFAERMNIRDIKFHRIGNGEYPKMVRHWAFYTLGNGLSLDDDKKSKLGNSFDFNLILNGVIPACNAGISYIFVNHDKIVFFPAAESPDRGAFGLLDERTSEIKAFVRFWRIDSDKPMNVELYEADGITDYSEDEDENLIAHDVKQPYKQNVTTYGTGETIISGTESYERLPIFPLYVNERKKSEFTRNLESCLVAIDYIMSDQVDQIMQHEGINTFVKNYGGETLEGLLRELQAKIYQTEKDVGTDISTTAVEAPYQAKKAALDRLVELAYSIFSMPEALGNRAVTATEIKDANKYLDTKSDILEWRICDTIGQILDFMGIEYGQEELSFKRRGIVNDTEVIDNISKMYSGDYLDIKAALEMNPYVESSEVDNILQRLDIAEQETAEKAFPLVKVAGEETEAEE